MLAIPFQVSLPRALNGTTYTHSVACNSKLISSVSLLTEVDRTRALITSPLIHEARSFIFLQLTDQQRGEERADMFSAKTLFFHFMNLYKSTRNYCRKDALKLSTKSNTRAWHNAFPQILVFVPNKISNSLVQRWRIFI